MTNVILIFYGGLFAATLWILSGVVSRWDEDHHKLDRLQKDLDGLYERFDNMQIDIDTLKASVKANAEDEAKVNNEAATDRLKMRNDISKLNIRVTKLEGKDTK